MKQKTKRLSFLPNIRKYYKRKEQTTFAKWRRKTHKKKKIVFEQPKEHATYLYVRSQFAEHEYEIRREERRIVCYKNNWIDDDDKKYKNEVLLWLNAWNWKCLSRNSNRKIQKEKKNEITDRIIIKKRPAKNMVAKKCFGTHSAQSKIRIEYEICILSHFFTCANVNVAHKFRFFIVFVGFVAKTMKIRYNKITNILLHLHVYGVRCTCYSWTLPAIP